MGVALFDSEDDSIVFSVNFWHWRAIVEAVKRLEVLPFDRVDALHELYCDHGLTAEECRLVANAVREKLLPMLFADERLLLDGSTTDQPDDGVFHRDPESFQKNYGTTPEVLERFADSVEGCNGFRVS